MVERWSNNWKLAEGAPKGLYTKTEGDMAQYSQLSDILRRSSRLIATTYVFFVSLKIIRTFAAGY